MKRPVKFIEMRDFGSARLPVFIILPEGVDSPLSGMGARDTDPIRAPALSRRVG